MGMLEHIQRLFTYDAWANRAVFAKLEELKDPPPRSLKYFAHILSAEKLWWQRLRLEKQTYAVWPDFTLAQCKLELDEMPKLWKEYLATASEAVLARDLTYKNSKGESWTSRKQDILLHVVMHSAYHRGQIATDMRAAGFVPAYTDFIHGVRQGLVE